MNNNQREIFDYIIIGSGFGGSVSALRLTEKGYKVLVIEKGQRKRQTDFPKSNWNIRKYLWLPILKCFGIQQLHFFNKAFILSGVGVGGGSLVYANTHMYPSKQFFETGSWSRFGPWQEKLQPFYQLAKKMLGTTKVQTLHAEDYLLKQVADQIGRSETFSPVDVGVYFSEDPQPKDPYFDGQGPLRHPCQNCAACMIGCPHGAKNTLDLNYLYLAEKQGCQIIAETEAYKIVLNQGIYEVTTKQSTRYFPSEKKYFSRGLVFSGGVLGTLPLLFAQKFKYQTMTQISDKLGESLRTNSESLCGTALANQKLNHGVAITSIIHPDENTFIEICKYPNGSGLMGKLGMIAAGPGSIPVRIFKSILNTFRQPIRFLKLLFDFEFASRSIFFLVMQTLDNSMKMIYRKSFFGWTMSMQDHQHKKVPAYIEVGQDVMNRYSHLVKGISVNSSYEVLFNLPSTAHILGGCPMGKNPTEGVVNERFQLNGYENCYVLDASVISANLGVNPSLTITAISEYAMSMIKSKSEDFKSR